MSDRDLGNAQNWEHVTEISGLATVISPGQILPIPKLTIPILLDKSVVAVRVDSVSAPPTWRFAGDIFQEIRVGIMVGGQPDAIATRRRVWLKQVALFFLPELSTSYALSFLPPKWFRDVTLTLWQFTGTNPNPDAVDNVALQQQLETIEQKINSLL